MKTITEKMDYDLFKTFFLEGNSEKMQTMWSNICKNPGFLSEGMQIDNVTNGMCPSFRAPMICFLMLRYPELVPTDLYEKLIDLVIRRKDVANSIYVGGNYLDFLSLILVNPNCKLEDYQREMILGMIRDNYGIEEEKRYVSYDELLDMESPMVSRLVSGDLEVVVSEYEYEAFKNGEVKHPEIARKYKDKFDYRASILANPNFSEMEKAFVQDHMYRDEEEFKQFINYYTSLIASRSGLDDFGVSYLSSITVDELREQFKNDPELLSEALFAKKLLDKHYQKENKLVRSVN